MSLPAKTKLDIISFADMTGGVSLNDPAISISKNTVAGSKNARFLKKGFDKWPGAINLTAQDACDDFLRSMNHHAQVDGTQYLYEVHGGKVYSVNKSNGALTELYDMTGDGEAWGGSHYGTFFLANGTAVIKVEGTTAYQVGITAPTGTTAAAVTSGGSLADGTYKLFASYARKVSGLDVLYSKGQSIADVVLSGGGGNGKITIDNFANSTDGQVGNKVVWMTDPNGATYYMWYDTDDNTTTTFDITSATPDNNALTYTANAINNDLPGAFTFLFAFDNRLWGVIGNKVYYSLKGGTVYNLEQWPANNYIEYPYQVTGLFSVGKHLCINTKSNGIIVQPNADVGARYEHPEQETSFKYMRTVGDWNGSKIGLTDDRVGLFNKETFTFDHWDYGYNIRPVLDRVWSNNDTDYIPCGIVHRRDNRIEYLLSVRDVNVNKTANNRTWALNLSRTYFADIDNFRAPWEMVGRGFNYVCIDDDNTMFMGQSFTASSTIYKELTTHSTEIGIYNDDGEYIDTATNMSLNVTTRTVIENMFTKVTIENLRVMMQINANVDLNVTIVDDPAKTISQESSTAGAGQSLWDEMTWADDDGVGGRWSAEYQQMYEFKGDLGTRGYSWNLFFSQVADDTGLSVSQIDVLTELETGHGI